jgi:hypothetical protein
MLGVQKEARLLFRRTGPITWQQPTLAGPIVLLPLAARGLTAVFGMGTGGPPANGHQELVLPVRGEKQKLRAMCADKGVK